MSAITQDIATLAAAFDVSVAALCGHARNAEIARVRAVAYRLLTERYSGPAVARAFGRNHSTIYQMRRRVAARTPSDPVLRQLTRTGRAALRAASGEESDDADNS